MKIIKTFSFNSSHSLFQNHIERLVSFEKHWHMICFDTLWHHFRNSAVHSMWCTEKTEKICKYCHIFMMQNMRKFGKWRNIKRRMTKEEIFLAKRTIEDLVAFFSQLWFMIMQNWKLYTKIWCMPRTVPFWHIQKKKRSLT